MAKAKCKWRADAGEANCTSAAEDNKYDLCQPHYDEMIRRAKVKRESWKVAAMESNKGRYNLALGLAAAADASRDALILFATQASEVYGNKSVIVGHSRTNSVMYNYVMGKVKASQIPVPGWEAPHFVNGAIFTPITGLSLEAARLYADTYNNSLSESGIEDTVAIVQ